jgi:hypothetical protein
MSGAKLDTEAAALAALDGDEDGSFGHSGEGVHVGGHKAALCAAVLGVGFWFAVAVPPAPGNGHLQEGPSPGGVRGSTRLVVGVSRNGR